MSGLSRDQWKFVWLVGIAVMMIPRGEYAPWRQAVDVVIAAYFGFRMGRE